jgi:hypothetical protein
MSELDEIYKAFDAGELTKGDAIQLVLHHRYWVGCRDDAYALIEEWDIEREQRRKADGRQGD